MAFPSQSCNRALDVHIKRSSEWNFEIPGTPESFATASFSLQFIRVFNAKAMPKDYDNLWTKTNMISVIILYLRWLKNNGPNRRLPELQTSGLEPEFFITCTQSVRSCVVCMTDYCIDITWYDVRKGWVIRSTTYLELGECRSPFDWNWHVMVHHGIHDAPRALDPLVRRPGIVRHMWSTGDDKVVEPQGKWEGDPSRAHWSSW